MELEETQEKAQTKLEVIVDSSIPCKLRKIPVNTTSMAAKDPDEANPDEHGQREILRTTNTPL